MFCRNGAIPLTFHEKMRRVFFGGGRGEDEGRARFEVCGRDIFMRFVGGGLMPRDVISVMKPAGQDSTLPVDH
jgi:hypothetical protein